jgi:hypothetical protein
MISSKDIQVPKDWMKIICNLSKKLVFLVIVAVFVLSCNKKENGSIRKFYKATKGEDTAYLSLLYTKYYFTGEYEIRYGNLGKDSGSVRGKFIGDTLKGDFCYRSYGGGIKRAPFVLLRNKEKLKLGSGLVSTYMTIPFYVKGTLEFKDSDFLFEQIDKNQYEK